MRNKFQSKVPAVAWRDCQQPSRTELWLEMLHGYTRKSRIHGLNQVLLPTMRRRMRLIWSLALACAFAALLSVSYMLAARYQRKSFQTVIADANAPLHFISFPVIIACNKNHLNWSRLSEVKKKFNISEVQSPLFEKILTAYDAVTYARFNVFEPLVGQPLETLNHLNFTEVAAEMAWRCDEMIVDCRWRNQPRNCCEIFHPRRSLQGLCLAFNEFQERRSTDVGSGTGLRARLLLQSDHHAPKNNESKGFILNIVEPSVWFGFPINLVPYTRAKIGISAVCHFYDHSTYGLSTERRQCVFNYETHSPDFRTLPGYKYMLENCLADCQQLYMMQYCNCTMDLFYPPSNYPHCKVTDLPCLAAHNHLFQYYETPGESAFMNNIPPGMSCDCLFNCKSLTLITDIGQSSVRPWKRLGAIQDNSEDITLDVFYKRDVLLVYKTSLVFTWVDLIVSFGGICQLCLGSSIISLIELSYFGLVNVPRFCWLQRQRQHRHRQF